MLDPADLLDGLTDAQQDAVGHLDGPLLVLAGPGSGKTTVVTRRIANLVANGIPAWQILALTFTNKAAGEMRHRVEAMLPEDVPGRRGLTVTTFHSFCARLLRRYAIEAGLSERYTIYDSGDQRDAMKRAIAECDLNTRNWPPASVAGAISDAKNRLLDAEGFTREAGDFYGRTVARIFAAYERILRSADAVDFDDLLSIVARVIRQNEGVRVELQSRYRYILIDEYQDTNHAQFVLAHSLAVAHGNICVVGDPDQSIYGWRGADLSNILDFEKHYPQATIVPLGQNFRSTGHIVETASALIANNRHRKDKRLFTELDEGERPQMVVARDEHHEARLIVDEFRRRADDDGVPWREMAVLYRVNALSRVLEAAFRDARIPYVIARGTAFYERKEIKDALAYLRVVANPRDEVSLRRIVNVPARGIGKTTLDKLEVHALNRQLSLIDVMREAETVEGLTTRAVTAVKKFASLIDSWRGARSEQLIQPVADDGLPALVDRVLRESGLEQMYRKSRLEEDQERVENLAELVSAAAEYTPMPMDDLDDEAPPPTDVIDLLIGFLESIALVSDADMVDPGGGAVTLMTLHTAKGLEFDAVAIAGLEEGMLPHSRAATDEMELEEERRLCFVGITRARRHLMLTRASMRTHRGLRERAIPSQFVDELGSAVVTFDQAESFDDFSVDDHDPFAGIDEMPFPPGCRVRHPSFGAGLVESITPRPRGSAARVIFDEVGPKTLILEYAKLERVWE